MKTEQNTHSFRFWRNNTASEVIAGRDLAGKVVVITGGHSASGLKPLEYWPVLAHQLWLALGM